MRRALWALLSIGLAAIIAFALYSRWRDGPPPPVFGALPDFTLRDQNDASFERTNLRGRVSIIGFIFTRCGGQCPMIVERMRSLDSAVAGHAAIERVLLSVDPEFDTPAVLSEYAREMRVDVPGWRLLTGDTDGVYALIRESFKLAVEPEGSMNPAEPILHSTRLVLVDRDGMVRGYFDSFDEASLAALGRTARRLARGRSVASAS